MTVTYLAARGNDERFDNALRNAVLTEEVYEGDPMLDHVILPNDNGERVDEPDDPQNDMDQGVAYGDGLARFRRYIRTDAYFLRFPYDL